MPSRASLLFGIKGTGKCTFVKWAVSEINKKISIEYSTPILIILKLQKLMTQFGNNNPIGIKYE